MALPNKTQVKKVAVRDADKALVLGKTCRAVLGEFGPLTNKDLHFLINRIDEKLDIDIRSVRRVIYRLRRMKQAVKAEERTWELTDAGFEASEA